MSERAHVIVGAAGALGAAIVQQLTDRQMHARAVVRDPEQARKILPGTAEIVAGDARNVANMRAACRDADVIYHCVNVPYQDWTSVMPQVTAAILAAAREVGARLIFPGNVYGYGPFQTLPATEDHPLAATSRKGRLRNQIERQLLAEHRARAVPVVIPRFPDFYGPNVTNRLMAPIFTAALARKRAMWMGNLDVPHDLIYIHDAARACVELAARDQAYGQTWHVPGAGALTGRMFIEMVCAATHTLPRMGAYRNRFLRIAGLFSPAAREMVELMYEFEQPLLLDGRKFAAAFPEFTFTPHQEAVGRTVEWFRDIGLRLAALP